MPTIETQLLGPHSQLTPAENLQTYCGLDCCVTLEVFEELSRQFNQPPQIYEFEKALQGPYLEMMIRGFPIDELSRRQAAQSLRERITNLQLKLNKLAWAVWDKPLNPRSPQQLKDFFYSAMHLPEVTISFRGQKRVSTNREALEKLEEKYLYARPFTSCILTIRDLAKQAEVFETAIDPDGRHRASYNIAGTETGRPSSSENAFGTGGNAQNISPSLRYVFTSQPGFKLGVIDLEQVEARDVGFAIGCLFDDWSYLDACESGDLHTNNAKRVWPELSWPNSREGDRKCAEQNFYRDFTYRDMAKRGSHLSNYKGTAWTASRALKVPLEVMTDFQARYCRGQAANPKTGSPAIEPAFGGIPKWWNWTAEQIQTTGWLENAFGRKRHFFGNPRDEATIREAIAFWPQSTTADRTNLGLWRIWKHLPECQVLAQTYDSVTFQYPETLDEQELIPKALKLMEVELMSPGGRKYVVPGEAKIGWNWGLQVTQQDRDRARVQGRPMPRLNVDGLVKWSPKARDSRARQTGLQRIMQ